MLRYVFDYTFGRRCRKQSPLRQCVPTWFRKECFTVNLVANLTGKVLLTAVSFYMLVQVVLFDKLFVTKKAIITLYSFVRSSVNNGYDAFAFQCLITNRTHNSFGCWIFLRNTTPPTEWNGLQSVFSLLLSHLSRSFLVQTVEHWVGVRFHLISHCLAHFHESRSQYIFFYFAFVPALSLPLLVILLRLLLNECSKNMCAQLY